MPGSAKVDGRRQTETLPFALGGRQHSSGVLTGFPANASTVDPGFINLVHQEAPFLVGTPFFQDRGYINQGST